MDSICAEQNKFHRSHQLLSSKKSLFCRDIDIPPIKILSRLSPSTLKTHYQDQNPDMFFDSPTFSYSDESFLQKFLSFNEDDYDSDPYSSDYFRMYEFKVRRCTRSRTHDWTDCPFAHPGEKARRRDPRKYHYSGTVCSDCRRGGCSRGDSCEFAHGVFECWLHPERYRTEACKDGKNCKRKVCFFAHTPRQLRILPPSTSPDQVSPLGSKRAYNLNIVSSPVGSSSYHCCLFCHHSVISSSPTSTLLGMSHLSPPISPPLSPANNELSGSLNGLSPISRYSDRLSAEKHHFSAPNSNGFDQLHTIENGRDSYKDSLPDLVISSLEAMNFNAINSPNSPISANSSNLYVPNWVDVSFNGRDQQQLILSTSTRNTFRSVNFFSRDCSRRSAKNFKKDKLNNNNSGSGVDADLGWVNDLLM